MAGSVQLVGRRRLLLLNRSQLRLDGPDSKVIGQRARPGRHVERGAANIVRRHHLEHFDGWALRSETGVVGRVVGQGRRHGRRCLQNGEFDDVGKGRIGGDEPPRQGTGSLKVNSGRRC